MEETVPQSSSIYKLYYTKTIVFPSATQTIFVVADQKLMEAPEALMVFVTPPHAICRKGIIIKPLHIVQEVGPRVNFNVAKRQGLEWYVAVEGLREVDLVLDEKLKVQSYTDANIELGEISKDRAKELLQGIVKIQAILRVKPTFIGDVIEDNPSEVIQRIAMFLYSYSLVPNAALYPYFEANDWGARVEVLLAELPSAFSKASRRGVAAANGKQMGTNQPGTKGEGAETTPELRKYYEDKIKALKISEEYKQELLKVAAHLVSQESSGTTSLKDYLDTILDYPWGEISSPQYDIQEIENLLDAKIFGMTIPKKKILEYLAVQQFSEGKVKSPVICLVGAPGIGKTYFAKVIAKALNRPFASLALGGMNDVNILRGQRRGWVGASPGLLSKAIMRAKAINPVVILDEVDKIGTSSHESAVKSALLEILDKNQNQEFRDYYLEIPSDLSKVLFIATANYYQDIPYVLANRMDVVFLDPYTDREKLIIAKEYEWPALLKEHTLSSGKIEIENKVWAMLLQIFRYDAGLRNITRILTEFVQKGIVKLLRDKSEKIVITIENIKDFTDIDIDAKISEHSIIDVTSASVGNVIYLAAMSGDHTGGVTGLVESHCLPGKGKFQFIGNLGPMAKGSMEVAYNYVRSVAQKIGISSEKILLSDIVVQFPLLGQKTEGPSAGAAIALSMISAICDVPVRQNIAITGELDIKGNVTGIGGLTKKIAAAYKMGIKEFVIPEQNKTDYDKLEDYIKNDIVVYYVNIMDEVLPIYFPDLQK